MQLNMFWMFLKFKDVDNIPERNGFMDMFTRLENFQACRVIFLPYVNGNPGDYNTLLTGVKS